MGIKASYYSRVTNFAVLEKAEHLDKPSDFLWKSQYNMMREIYNSFRSEAFPRVVFCSAHKD